LLKLQLNPVLLVAVVLYVVVVVPFVNWQVGSVPDDIVIAVGNPTVGVTVICLLSDVEPQEPPVVVKVRVAVPEYPAGGVHVAFKSLTLGLKVHLPALTMFLR
jgi:hypothetical protein